MHAHRGEATPILPRKVKRPATVDQIPHLVEAFHCLIEQGIPVTGEDYRIFLFHEEGIRDSTKETFGEEKQDTNFSVGVAPLC